ncbi:hypothetical protein EXE44_05055 [Halorubrum sp. SS7]|uniref:DUF1073 domain-containing protein n=5 Tax=unclassified Halorubrum TaxID=2642239 RepID=UPI0010FA42A7|nr:DUF1073 domain-containing protein [Halorubrum sp. SS7]TKX58916.1 hypothetical protein EXE44_05055 [Halorubrum sp. SS7]
MSDAFSDVLNDEGESTELETTTPTDVDSSSVFNDAVRSELQEEDQMAEDAAYEDPETGKQSDNVDPRALFANASVNELRFYYRQGPYGGTVVEKPIYDSFKYGFDIEATDPDVDLDQNNRRERIKQFLQQYKEAYIDAKIKARRDGLALLHFQFADAAGSVSEPIQHTRGEGNAVTFQGFQTYSLDNISDDLAESTVAEHTEYDDNQIYVSEGDEHGGVAIVDDIESPDHGDVVGYGIEPRQDSDEVDPVFFLHEDRVQHITHGEHVDGRLGNNVTGKHVGESVLTPVLQPLKATHMGFWAIKNILYRYSAPLHAVEPPESWGMDEWDEASGQMSDLSMMSDALLPPGSELSVAEGVSEFDPEPFFAVLINALCAGTEFTKSVLEGTQTGTVSGSETDVKNYFNFVERLRTGEIQDEMMAGYEKVARHDPSTVPQVSGGFTIDWGPLFKPTDIERAEGMVSIITAATNGIKNYVLTPSEAREVIEAGWAEFDMDTDLGESLTEAEMDTLDRINMNEAGQGLQDNEPNNRTAPQQGGSEGGRPEGPSDASQPQADSEDAMKRLIENTDLTREEAFEALNGS